MSEAKIDEFPCLFPASRVLEFQRRVRSRLQKKLPAGYTIEAGGTVEESAKGLRSIALIFPMMIFLMLTILMVQLQSFQKMFLVISVAPLV